MMKKLFIATAGVFVALLMPLSAENTIFADSFAKDSVADPGTSTFDLAHNQANRQTGSVGPVAFTDSHNVNASWRTQIGNAGSANLFLTNQSADSTEVWASYDRDWAADAGVGQNITFRFGIGGFTASNDDGAVFPNLIFRFGGSDTSRRSGGVSVDSSLSLSLGTTAWSFNSGATVLSGNVLHGIDASDLVSVTIHSGSTVSISISEEVILSDASIATFNEGSNYVTFTKGINDGEIGAVRFEDFSVSVSSVPEPQTYALFLGAMCLSFAATCRVKRLIRRGP